jgi:hypothetical protein
VRSEALIEDIVCRKVAQKEKVVEVITIANAHE